MRTSLKYGFILLCLSGMPARADVNSLQLDELTSSEVRSKIAAGTTTILIPIGATEQSGAHLVLGKHNVRARLLAEQIAKNLGNALVAPVLAYVPEGAVNPPAGHMRFAGTISIPDAAFEAVLQGAARSFKQHGFRNIVFLGDHGGYQKNLLRVAQRLKAEWSREHSEPRCRVLAMTDYYRLGSASFAAILKKRGFTDAEIGKHAGLADTALSMAVDKNLLRSEALAHTDGEQGVVGDPRRATAELGQLAVQEIVAGTVAAIRAETNPH